MNEVLKRIEERKDSLKAEAVACEHRGRLTEKTVQDLREIGFSKMLQSKRWGGYESHPVEFCEASMTLARYNAPAGWICGVVGVHPWEISGFSEKLQNDIWGQDPETWVSSPYMPLGMLEKVDGGYFVKGRIPFSSGGEECQWAITGALMPNESGGSKLVHIVLPRKDYDFDQDSWDVIGLRGTGSKDLVCEGAVIPEDRIYDPALFDAGQYFAELGIDSPLFKIPFPTIFSYAINSSSQGVAMGAMDAILDNARKRVDATGKATLEDPYQMTVLAECAAEVRAGAHVLRAVGHRMYDEAVANGVLSFETRAEIRADGVRAVRRSADAVEKAFNYVGGRGLQMEASVNRGLRDTIATLAHICNNQHPIYQVWARVEFGLDHNAGMAFW